MDDKSIVNIILTIVGIIVEMILLFYLFIFEDGSR